MANFQKYTHFDLSNILHATNNLLLMNFTSDFVLVPIKLSDD